MQRNDVSKIFYKTTSLDASKCQCHQKKKNRKTVDCSRFKENKEIQQPRRING